MGMMMGRSLYCAMSLQVGVGGVLADRGQGERDFSPNKRSESPCKRCYNARICIQTINNAQFALRAAV